MPTYIHAYIDYSLIKSEDALPNFRPQSYFTRAHTHTHTHTHTNTRTYKLTHTNTHTRTHTNSLSHTHTHIHTHTTVRQRPCRTHIKSSTLSSKKRARPRLPESDRESAHTNMMHEVLLWHFTHDGIVGYPAISELISDYMHTAVRHMYRCTSDQKTSF